MLKRDLCQAGYDLIETHISWVFLRGDEVFKVKKPVDLGFLDFTTIEKRRAACEAEVALNRRLAPDVYRGVVPVRRDARGRYHLRGEGDTADWAVHMRRLPDADRADVRLREGRLGPGEVGRLAEHLADFHAGATTGEEAGRFGSVRAISENVRENFEQTRETIGLHLGSVEAAEIEANALRFLREHAERFEARVAAGRVRDGHGDLRLDQIYLPAGGEPPLVLDCIEFNERFRYGDVCADIAFLSMDLVLAGRVDLAERFLAAYAQASGDYELYRLVDFYEGYRAYVRGKVGAILAADEGAEPELRAEAAARARRSFLLAVATGRRSLLPPAVVAVGGIIASGKSTIAEQIAAEMGAPIVDSDRTRKQLAGVATSVRLSDGSWTGYYSEEFTAAVYDEVLARARAVLASGRPVVLDASFRTRAMRDGARALAEAYAVPFHLVECRVDPEICRARLRRREQEPSGPSDARLSVLDSFVARFEPIDELPPGTHVVLDTGLPLDRNVERLRRELPVWPHDLTGP